MDALVDAGRAQMSALPSINFLDSEKLKREGERHQNGSASAMASPPFQFSSRPPLYNHTPVSSGLISPPESRRTSGEEQAPIPPARQSLPSIHEALGRDTPLNYPGPPPPPPNSLPTPTSSYFSQSAPASASDPSRKRSFAAITPPPPPSYSQPTQRSPYMGHPPPGPSQSAPLQQPPSSRPEALTGAAMFSQGPKIPSLHVRTGKSPPTSSGRSNIAYSSQQSPALYQHSPQSAPPNASFGYSNHQSQYAYQAASSSGQGYPAPAVLSAPPRYPQPPVWGEADIRAEEMKRAGRTVIPAYGENVKRHLEQFDYEASLNSVFECAGQILDFSQSYRQRSHPVHRSGPSPGSMPTMKQLEELNPVMRRLQENFDHLRDVVATAAMAEQQKDPALTSNGYGSDHNGYLDDGKNGGGFAGPDPKKRRGRAAPPGRCHSCNRAETPEWRRGPDGARTLCNACGLHYAKLTRKMGTTSKAAIPNSSLRPKSLGEASPTS